MYDFNYHKPSSSNAAASAVAGADDGKFLAGGQTLLPTMKQRLAMPSDLVDLAGCDLSGVRVDGDNLVIGAMTTHDAVATSGRGAGPYPGPGRPGRRHRRSAGA